MRYNQIYLNMLMRLDGDDDDDNNDELGDSLQSLVTARLGKQNSTKLPHDLRSEGPGHERVSILYYFDASPTICNVNVNVRQTH